MHHALLRELVRQERRQRNNVTGYWIAEADPDAARHGILRRWQVRHLWAALVMTDGVRDAVGACRALADWSTLAHLAVAHGPAAVLAAARAAEDNDPSTATILRRRGENLDYLVLGDSPLLLDRGGQVEAVTDDRMAHLKDYSHEAMTAVQNTPDGYYVLRSQHTARRSIHVCSWRNRSRSSMQRGTLYHFTDGAARLVDFKHLTCPVYSGKSGMTGRPM